MVKSAAERQAEFRAKSKDKFKRLDTLLPVEIFNLLHGNTTKQGLTKAAYIAELLHGNNAMVKGVDTVLPDNEKLHGNSKELTRLQSAVEELELERVAIKKQLKAGAGDREAKQALQKERDALLAQVKELERVAGITDAILNDKNTEITRLKAKQKPANTNLSKQGYDGNPKEFKAALVGIVGNDNNVISAARKRAYEALGIVPTGNGRLSSDAERLAVYEWLRDN